MLDKMEQSLIDKGTRVAPHLDSRYMPYSVGALLYAPASNEKLLSLILQNSIQAVYSAAFCLEDTISQGAVKEAESNLVASFAKLSETASRNPFFYFPNLFIRVRSPEQISDLYRRLGDDATHLTGFIIPKYSPRNAAQYNEEILRVNRYSDKIIYMMPTLESQDIVNPFTRLDTLKALREYLDAMEPYVLNIRMGGNDFCNAFGIRRHYNETIYDILPVNEILSAIASAFIPRYVVSAPVWEYFSSENWEWKSGLQQELRRDMLNGFIGKTIIHPKQIPVVNDALRVSEKDYNDARSILSWSEGDKTLVMKNSSGERMNEVQTHKVWAEKIMILAKIYGVE